MSQDIGAVRLPLLMSGFTGEGGCRQGSTLSGCFVGESPSASTAGHLMDSHIMIKLDRGSVGTSPMYGIGSPPKKYRDISSTLS